MKRIFFLSLLAILMCMPMQADSYHDALLDYMTGSGVVNAGQYEDLMEPMAKQFFPDDPQAAKAFAEYFKSQLFEDVVDVYEPAFRRHLSEAELKELIKMFDEPRLASLQERSMEIVSTLSKSPEYQLFMEQYAQSIQNIIADLPAADVQIADELSSEYKDAFYAYYRHSGVDDILMGAYRSLFDTMGDEMRKIGVTDPQAKVNLIGEYTSRNMPKVLMALSNKSLTLDDLKMLDSLTDRPAYRHAMEAVAEMASNPMALGTQLLTKMADWMETNHPEYGTKLKETMKALDAFGK